MDAVTKHIKKLFTRRFLVILLVLIGTITVLFNDTFGRIEGFPEFLFLYFIIVIVTVLHWLFVNIRLIINLKNEKKKTELLHLQSQVNPHFFFNMLNNLYGLIDTDNDKAKKLVLKLSDMMRYSIYEGQKEWVSLAEEIDFIKNYIELHKMRYHKEVRIDFDIEVENSELKLMPLLFIILLENAFKHGVEVIRKNAFIDLNMKATQHKIVLEIANNYNPERVKQQGIGLENLKRRLALVYPNKHSLSHTTNGNIYTTKLTLQV